MKDPEVRGGDSAPGGVTWYALLGVAPDATPDEVKQAWRDATDRFEPGSGTAQFALFNDAAAVLLDPARRAAYDEQIGVTSKPAADTETDAETAPVADEAEPAAAPVVVEKAEEPAPVAEADEVAEDEPTSRRRTSGAPAWLLAVLAVLTVAAVAVGAIFLVQDRRASADDDAGDESTAAAERALPAILSYDYRHLTTDRDQAVRFLSARYKKEYSATFDKLIESDDGKPGPAAQTKAVVKASVEDIGVVSATSGRTRLIVFLNQTTTKGDAAATLSLNRLTVSMVKSGNSWLVDDISSY